jgi:hypothetical protein
MTLGNMPTHVDNTMNAASPSTTLTIVGAPATAAPAPERDRPVDGGRHPGGRAHGSSEGRWVGGAPLGFGD